eukprot:CAMPEP_0172536504 /NCGR_PEP_ID=MMETSP1067-20121228/8260_1 /TAXON_ID=265564 ORGANISM="Thalassiosira punctigera, Strain Tpunct2005C2" /NCGR_SAMPLE_ID=MMETSP1067 /ASSEMBLY_ACC=CAM_ASM_000444 /LENGTH=865 /DNA_ID=CAMNT_0013321593 /DNA_START=47 /DNA_END=2641 /DNA_ORIENTATION=-
MAPNILSKTSSLGVSDSSLGSINVPTEGRKKAPKLGPEPTLLSRRQVDALYSLLEAVAGGLKQLEIPYILTGGSLLGAIRQHSILFCDDDIDLAILESDDGGMYERAKSKLPSLLGAEYQYTFRPWEGGDKVRIKSCSNVFLDVFVIKEYRTIDELTEVIGVKKNGGKQSDHYVKRIVEMIFNALHSQGEILPSSENDSSSCGLLLPFPIWHFNTRKAIELWPKEVYRFQELFPTVSNLKMGPVVGLSSPNAPVWLLNRAFGIDCFEVYYQSISHGRKVPVEKNGESESTQDGGKCDENKSMISRSNFSPLVSSGGQWAQNTKTLLTDEHYLPMQPVSRTKRRHTLHDKSTLFGYLKCQSKQEVEQLRKFGILPLKDCSESAPKEIDPQAKNLRIGRTVYMDGVFDLFHIGHLHAIQQCAVLGDRVVIGVTGDNDASSYKRKPIISQKERAAIVKSLKVVDDVVCPCPLVVTKDFMLEWGIDLVVHGFADPKDKLRQREFFQVAMDQDKFQEIEYYSQLNTTDIIRRIQAERSKTLRNIPKTPQKNGINPKWFGAALSAATGKSPSIPFDPFPILLRNVIEQHLQKATRKREEALEAIGDATGTSFYKETLANFNKNNYSEEGQFDFDTHTFHLREKFLQSCSLPTEFNLSQLHKYKNPENFKDEMLLSFAKDRICFQEVYDEFVRSVCCPFVASLSNEPIDEVYYQSFPCVRVVRPGDFSIGPHADSSYGHHPCSINFYVPLTKIEGSASLFLESRPGSEDWHPIEGGYGIVKHFAGAICVHWTPENHTDFTRVSIDFRVIPGPMFHTLKCGGKRSGGVRDVYREKEGYYNRSCCKNSGSESVWVREGSLQVPDARFGFPWTKL